MRMLDFETANLAGATNRQRAAIAAAWELVEESFRALEAMARSVGDAPSEKLKAVLVSIAAECVRRFRAIVALCELGQPENVTVLSRSLFEAMLAGRFIVRRGPSKYGLPAQSRVPRLRPAEFRALLYGMAVTIRTHGLLQKSDRYRGLKRGVPRATRRQLDDQYDTIVQALGNKWVEKIRSSNSFSGLNIADLAKHCGFERDYRSLYGLDSTVAHGGFAMNHIEFPATGPPALKIGGQFAECVRRAGAAACHLTEAISDVSKALELQVHQPCVRLRDEFGRQSMRVD